MVILLPLDITTSYVCNLSTVSCIGVQLVCLLLLGTWWRVLHMRMGQVVPSSLKVARVSFPCHRDIVLLYNVLFLPFFFSLPVILVYFPDMKS